MKFETWLSRDRNTMPWPYQQADIKGCDGGVCFRLAFKWLACKVYGNKFKATQEANAGKIVAKQARYLEKVAPYEKCKYPQFADNVDRISLKTLNEWGTKEKNPGVQNYHLTFRSERRRHLSTCPEFGWDGIRMVIGIYGGSKDGNWAHATAFFRDGEHVNYFDPNGGEFDCTDDHNIGSHIITDIAERYAGDGYTINEFSLYITEGA